MRKSLLFITAICLFTSCTQRGCQRYQKAFQTTERDYEVIMFSGGDTVFRDSFSGIVTNSEHSDGVYYFKGSKMYEVSGDYVIISK